jgi:hypothetical protein
MKKTRGQNSRATVPLTKTQKGFLQRLSAHYFKKDHLQKRVKFCEKIPNYRLIS